MDQGILSIKMMILGAVLFLCGCELAFANSLPAVPAFMAGPVMMLIGLLMGNRKGAKI